MSKHPPYFPFYPDDWLDCEKIFKMDLECEGAYIRVLSALWKKGGYIPDDSRWCCNILRCKPAKWKKIRKVLVEDSQVLLSENGKIFNRRLNEELEVFLKKSQKSSDNANKRWRNEGKKVNKINESNDAVAMQPQCHTDLDTDLNKDKSKRKNIKKKFELPENIDQKLWDEWMQVRITKKAVNSETALRALIKKLIACSENGTTANDAIIIAIENSWKTIQPGWIEKIKSNGQSKPSQEREKFVRKPSEDFIQQHPELDENVLAGEFTRLNG